MGKKRKALAEQEIGGEERSATPLHYAIHLGRPDMSDYPPEYCVVDVEATDSQATGFIALPYPGE